MPDVGIPIVVLAIGLPIGLVAFGIVGSLRGEEIALALLPDLPVGADPMKHRVLGLVVSIVPFSLLSVLVAVNARLGLPRAVVGVIAGLVTLVLGSNALWLGSRYSSDDERIFGSAVDRVDAFQVGLGAGLLGVFGSLGLFIAVILIMARIWRAGPPRKALLQWTFAASLVIGWVGAVLLVVLPGR